MDTLALSEFFNVLASKYMGLITRGITVLGSMYLIFWIIKPKWINKFRVPQMRELKTAPKSEAFYSFATYIIYALSASVVAYAHKLFGHSMMYTNISDYGLTYTILSFFIFMIYIDSTFYWSHYLMHKNKTLYKIHKTHHKFINVTPWAAYAFHTGEAIINAGSFMLLMLIIPWHPIPLFMFVVFSASYNGMVHLGYDLYPKSWRKHRVMKWWNTTTHHCYHHQKFDCNYSFFFTFWDKWMKTEKLPAD